MKDRELSVPTGTFEVFADGKDRPQVRVLSEYGSMWMTQLQIAELYHTTQQNVDIHIRNIYEEGEFSPEATYKKYLLVRPEGKRQVQRGILHYNLDIIIAVGYRVKSPVATRFRKWATERLKEYLIKGFTLDDERLKGNDPRQDHFDELLARIRDIRASEKRAYQRVREIFALASDYEENRRDAQVFFANMQNKMHYAATGYTAAEIVMHRADALKPNMGLTSWKGGQVLKGDVSTAKNYLDEKEIDILNRIVSMFLEHAEFRVLRRQNIKTAEWDPILDKFLLDNELPVLNHLGQVSHEQAQEYAVEQYERFDRQRRTLREEEAEKRYLEDLKQTASLLIARKTGK